MRRVNYKETLCGLLHDIGKPLLRYLRRVDKGLEESDKDLLNLITRSENHEIVGVEFVRKITDMKIDISLCEYFFKSVLTKADYIAAAERGIGEKYKFLRDKWNIVEKSISNAIKLPYGHEVTPLLSPLWILALSKYASTIGPCAKSPFTADQALFLLVQHYKPYIDSLEREDVNGLSNEITKTINNLKDEPLWLPPQPLTAENIRRIKAQKYEEAQRQANYYGISKLLKEGLELLTKIYDSKITRGYIDTLNEVLKYTLLTVPAAVYLAFPPDTSLYSHSKVVAAYASALSLEPVKSNTGLRLLVIDARRIQDFISSPVVPKAASRVIRGRSFLVELISISLLNYILELYGGLPYVNVLTSEGGTISIIVPAFSRDKDEHEKIISYIRKVISLTHERIRGLSFSVAISDRFGLDEVNFIENLKELMKGEEVKRKTLLGILESLGKTIAREKIVDDSRYRITVPETAIAGFDAITREPVKYDEISSGYGLRVDENTKEYAGLISGGKLEIGDIVCEATHLSLIAGSALRNLVLLLTVYLYKYESSQSDEEQLVPASEEIDELVDLIKRSISENARQKPKNFELLFSVQYQGFEFNIAIVPLPSLGSLHVMISSVAPYIPIREEKKLEGSGKGFVESSLILNTATMLALKIVESITEKLKQAVYSRVELRAVNTGIEFIELLRHKDLQDKIRKLIEKNVDFYLGTIHTGTHHPYTLKVEKHGVKYPLLVDLDVYNLIAIAKADADNLGEVKKLVSFSPTRIASLSDLLTTIITYKAHLLAMDFTLQSIMRLSRATSGGFEPRGPIILYAGGDDIAFYGYWVDVLLFLSKLYEEVFTALYPLSFTSAVAIERSDYPLLELYSKVAETLSSGKKEARGWVFIAELASPKPVECTDGIKIVSGLQPLEEITYLSGPRLTTPLELYSSIAKLFEQLEENPEETLRISNYKREAMIISRTVGLNDGEYKALLELLRNEQPKDVDAFFGLTRRFVLLSYISARREKNLEELANLIGKLIDKRLNIKIHHQPGENIVEAFKRALCSKTFIDLLILYLNPHSRVISKP